MDFDRFLVYALPMWPAVELEELTWTSHAPMSRRAQAKQPATYESALVPAIASEAVELSAALVAKLEQATVAAARFDAEHAGAILPFAPLLLRGESFASSRIEQLSSTARRILEAEVFGSASGNADLIAANTALMRAASRQEVPDVAALATLHEILLSRSAPAIAGKFRTEPVWIGGPDAHPVGALFVPPHQRHLERLLTDLVEFLHRTDIPALAHAALTHAQFETIHPFADGNGRTGRALIHIVLRAHGLAVNGILPLSAALLRDTSTYFAALDAYRDGSIAPIVALFADAALHATELDRGLATQLTQLRADWNDEISARRDAVDWKLADFLLRQPLVDAAMVAEELDVTPANARRALERLEHDGVIVSAQVTKKKRAWRAPEVLELLDEFADAARRPGLG